MFFRSIGENPCPIGSQIQKYPRSTGCSTVRYGMSGNSVLPALLLTIVTVECGAQSLGEVARQEAERRRKLDHEGKAGKTISDQDLARHGRNGNITISRPEPPRKEAPSSSSGPRRSSVASFQNRLRSLDRQIRQTVDRIAFLQERLAKERWAPPGTGRQSRRGRTHSSEEQLRWQIHSLENRLTSLRQERREVYDTGRKAGFLPGELDGKGIIP